MKVATYNVNGVNGRLPRLLEWLDETKPDIVCLQEIKTTDKKCPARALAAAGYGSIWHGQRSHHGVAILAKGERPVEIRRGLPGDDTDLQARQVEARVKGLVVASVYLPNGNPQPGPKFDYKLAWFERLTAHAKTLIDSGKPVVLAGDLNVVPERIYTFWVNDAAFRRDAGFRMDFLLLTPDLLPRLRGTGVDREHRGREKPSDHAPVWVEL